MILFGRHGSDVAGGQVTVDGCAGDYVGFGYLGGAFPVGASGSRGRRWSPGGGQAGMVPSWIMSRSSLANSAIMTKKNFPSPVGLSNPVSVPVRIRRPTPWSWGSTAMGSTSVTDRPRRSNFHSNKVSAGRRRSSAFTSPGRAVARSRMPSHVATLAQARAGQGPLRTAGANRHL